MGDFGYANGKQPVWDRWFEILEPLAAEVPVMVCPGNHEYEPRYGISTYLARFVHPGKETYYRFDYSNARFLMVDSIRYRDEEQLRWLQNELRDARNDRSVHWLILCMHHPLYSSTTGRLNDAKRIRVLGPLLDKYRPDLVLLGHQHNYERTYPLRGRMPHVLYPNRYFQGQGVVYVISGGGGYLLYPQTVEQPPFTARREMCHQYLRVTVSRDALKVVSRRTKDDSLLDQFEILR